MKFNQQKFAKFPMVLMATIALAACGDEDDKSDERGSLDASAMGSSDFTAMQPTEASREDVEEMMEDFDWHENKSKSSIGMSLQHAGRLRFANSLRRAVADKLPPSFALTQFDGDEFLTCSFKDSIIQAEGSRFWWEFTNPDFGTCMAQQLQAYMADATAKIVLSGYLAKSCDGADFSALNGKKIVDFLRETGSSGMEDDVDLNGLGGCSMKDNAAGYHFKMAFSGTVAGTMTFGGQSKPLNMALTTKTATMASDGGACRFEGKGATVTVVDCEHFDLLDRRTDSNGEVEEKRELVKASSTQATGGEFSEYYQEGEMSVSFNGWQGSVALDGSSSPDYEFSKGSDSVSGRVGW